ncbi:hypothetical protein PQ469_24440 [Mucilaginibacter sp. KACC 22773]|uniref:hypothetical protein n=1 Tax=Mucilaginibacter sp. KACC 22773 TaxID=3025671 RepID=UPI0023668588|nr:hypothetical protein [Mucilaginibacter sp. KACC 22773]WDF77036.1 hypothetical protein PQ469_24440 [Mucilaginibacter sp. KACC 22773]
MNEQDTIGLMVIVSPVLWSSDYMGRIGLIEFAEFADDHFWVRFEDEEIDCFRSETLFILRTPGELQSLAENKKGSLWAPIPQLLQKIAGMQEAGSAKQLKQAFELVQDDPELHRWATTRLNEVIEIAPTRKIGR